ncbi:hypothetical protein HDU96_010355 [Phlyctochytrium bullatum]|nr:hypothetical protein HDU96_010355 [Phlyctochytrium bullatum]
MLIFIPPYPRRSGLLELLRAENPDLICLQEVTQPVLKALHADPWFPQHYHILDTAFKKLGNWYGVVTLVRKDTLEIRSDDAVSFPRTQFGRNLHLLELRGRKRSGFRSVPRFRIGQSHFESLENPEIRLQQLKAAAAHAACQPLPFPDAPTVAPGKHVAAFICGDTNCYFPQESRRLEEVGFADAWATLHPDDDGPTFGLTYGKHTEHVSRIDRIGWQGEGVRPIEVKRIGMEMVTVRLPGAGAAAGEVEQKVLHVSDHVGVMAVFEFGG